MKPEEAIKRIDEHIAVHRLNEPHAIYITEALQMAKDALKKQIPKKPTGEHYAHMRCPSCNHRIPSRQGSSSRRRDNWCNYCGQAIDWGES